MNRVLLTWMQHRCPAFFQLLRTVWWLVRHRQWPPTYKASSELDYPRYRQAMERALVAASASLAVDSTYAVVLMAEGVTAAESRSALLGLKQQQWRPQCVLVCGVLDPAVVRDFTACFALKKCQDLARAVDAIDVDVLLFLKAGAGLRPYAAGLLLDAFTRQSLACVIHADFEERCAQGNLRLGVSDPAQIANSPLLAWHKQRNLPSPGLLRGLIENSWVQGQVFHLPAVLSEVVVQQHVTDEAEPLRSLVQVDVADIAGPQPSISVVIPTRDGGLVLQDCVEAVCQELQLFGEGNELIVVDNGSRDPITLEAFRTLQAKYPGLLRVLQYDRPFNYSAINNWAVQQATGELLLLLNDDIKPLQSGWLAAMHHELAGPRVGIVGARLLYPDQTLQHAGIAMGLGGVAGHPGRGLAMSDPRWRFWPHNQVKPVCAVTGACLLTSRQVYLDLKGLNADDLSVAFNDVDFCLRARAAGWKVIYTPVATMVHYESLSRGAEDTAAKHRRFAEEIRYMRNRWPELIACDPYYSPHLSDHLDNLSFQSPSAESLLNLQPDTFERIRDS